MAVTEPRIIDSPRFHFSTLLWGGLIALFGALLLIAGVQEDNVWYLILGGVVALMAIPVLLQYQRTTIDTGQGIWIRSKGSILGATSESGELSEIAELRVKRGLDSKGHDYWKVMLVRNGARNVDWHLYTYLGRKRMERDVAELEAALGLSASWIDKTSR